MHLAHHLDGRGSSSVDRSVPEQRLVEAPELARRARACRRRARPSRCAKARCAARRCGTAPCSSAPSPSTTGHRVAGPHDRHDAGRRARRCVVERDPEVTCRSVPSGARISSRTYRSIGRPSTASTIAPSTFQPVTGWYAAAVPGSQSRGMRGDARDRRPRTQMSSSKALVAVHREAAGVGEHVAERAPLLAAAPAVDEVGDEVVEAEPALLPELEHRDRRERLARRVPEHQVVGAPAAGPGLGLAHGDVEQGLAADRDVALGAVVPAVGPLAFEELDDRGERSRRSESSLAATMPKPKRWRAGTRVPSGVAHDEQRCRDRPSRVGAPTRPVATSGATGTAAGPTGSPAQRPRPSRHRPCARGSDARAVAGTGHDAHRAVRRRTPSRAAAASREPRSLRR